MLSELRVGVQSLVRELKFHKPPGTAKNKKTKKKRKLKRKKEKITKSNLTVREKHC